VFGGRLAKFVAPHNIEWSPHLGTLKSFSECTFNKWAQSIACRQTHIVIGEQAAEGRPETFHASLQRYQDHLQRWYAIHAPRSVAVDLKVVASYTGEYTEPF
jgi:hypothetical protein